MNWIDPYIFLLMVLGVGVLLLAFILLRSPRKLSRSLLASSAGLVGTFILLAVSELISEDRSTMLILRNLQQVCLILSPIFLFGYAKELHKEETGHTLRTMGFLVIPSIIDILLVFTDSLHGWMRESVTIKTIWNYNVVSIQSTALNSFLGSYSFVLALLTIFLLVRNMFDVPKHYRKTHLLSALVIALPIVAIITVPLLGIKMPGLFALSYGSMTLLLILVNKRVDYNAVWPVSRQEVLETLSEGILLIDQQGRIVELNQASYGMIKRSFGVEVTQSQLIHQPIQGVVGEVSPLMEALEHNKEVVFEFEHNGFYFHVHVKTFNRKSNQLKLVVWRDITDKKQVELQLRELAELDPLTKLMNREAFITSFYEKNETEESCFILMDIDHFKSFNDRYGHLVGDQMLRFVALLLKTHFPDSLVTRLGGEEFGVYLPCDVHSAILVAQDFQAALKEQSYSIDPAIQEQVTVSIGISPVNPGTSFEMIYHEADQAMYRVKHEGRDSIRVC